MIVNQDVKPEKQAYLLGAEIIRLLLDSGERIVNPFTLYETLNLHHKVSYHAFAMAMNWLYLIGALDLVDNQIIKCF